MEKSVETYQYSPLSRLNTLEIHHVDSGEKEDQAYWIVYIHGGAWRDPAIDSSSIAATLPHLAPVASHIKGVASLNYRLSPYPEHPTDPSGDDPARNATHPQHIEDVMTAICWLQCKYGFKERYILIGHSAGATLAFQSVSGIWKSRESTTEYPLTDFVSPVAIVGVAGIYDIKTLIESFFSIPVYREIIEGAFGKDEQAWKHASPTNYNFRSTWANSRVSVIADSDKDGLVDQAQSEEMHSHLLEYKSEACKVDRLKLYGDHDSIWIQGSELARAIIHTIELLRKSS